MTGKQTSIHNLEAEFLVVCASCQAVKVPTGWLVYEKAQIIFNLQKIDEMDVSHSICRPCAILLYGAGVEDIFKKEE